jgi:ABC-type transport system involved in multi-copper enzyme maturation permease subunit
MESANRLAVIAGNTFRESVRQRFFVIVALAASSLVVAAWWLRDCSFGACREKFLLDAGFGCLTFFSAVVAIAATAESFFAEIERKTVLAALARPLARWEFVVGKLAGILWLLLVFCLAETLVLVGLLWWQKTAAGGPPTAATIEHGSISFFAVIACGFVEWLRCCILAAVTLLVSTYAQSRLLAVAAGFVAWVASSLQSFAWGPSGSGGVGGPGLAGKIVGFVAPDFSLYDVADGVANGGTLSFGFLSGIALYSVVYLGMLLALAAYCFRHREL